MYAPRRRPSADAKRCRSIVGTSLPGQHQHNRAVARLACHPPCDRGFVRVRRPDDRHVRDRSKRRELLDRLMCRPIFAQRDAVVSKDVNHMQLHERRQPDRRTHVVGEDQERRAVRKRSAVRGEPIRDRAHRVLAHAKMDVPSGEAHSSTDRTLSVCFVADGRTEVSETGEPGLSRRIQVRRPADERGQQRRDRIHHLARSGARGHALRVGRKSRDIRVPSRWKLTANARRQLLRHIGVRPRIRRQAIIPLRFGAFAAAPPPCGNADSASSGIRKGGSAGQPKPLFGKAHFLLAQRGTVGLEGILFVRRAVADVGAHRDQRRPARFRAGRAAERHR